jgi:hypothetical protein
MAASYVDVLTYAQPLVAIFVFLGTVFEAFAALLDVLAGALHGVATGHEYGRQRGNNYLQVHDGLLFQLEEKDLHATRCKWHARRTDAVET